MGQYADFNAAVDYLFAKHCRTDHMPSRVNLAAKDISLSDTLSKEDADKMIRLHREKKLTATAIALRFNRSPSLVSKLVNGKHKHSRHET